jgi:hypothetical protein
MRFLGARLDAVMSGQKSLILRTGIRASQCALSVRCDFRSTVIYFRIPRNATRDQLAVGRLANSLQVTTHLPAIAAWWYCDQSNLLTSPNS